MIRPVAIALSVIAVGGCGLIPPAPPIVHQPMTARAAPPPEASVSNGAIYQVGYNNRPLFEDRRARNVGDTLVININENTAANKNADTSAAKTGKISVASSLQNIPGPGKNMTSLGVTSDSQNSYEGKGASTANNVFTGTITVTVIEVLANGNLLVSGEKQLGINQGSEFIRFSGIVNPSTVVGNSVASTQVADARIEYRANGVIDESQTMGWLARFFLNVLPF